MRALRRAWSVLARRLGQQPLAYLCRDLVAGVGQERGRRYRVQAGDQEFGQSLGPEALPLSGTRPGQDRHPLGPQSAASRRQRVGDGRSTHCASSMTHKRGLADPGLAAQDQRAARPDRCRGQQGVDRRALAFAPEQPPAIERMVTGAAREETGDFTDASRPARERRW
jgi:hypothetical protein